MVVARRSLLAAGRVTEMQLPGTRCWDEQASARIRSLFVDALGHHWLADTCIESPLPNSFSPLISP